MKTQDAAKLFQESIKFLFIDGNHSYDGAKIDMQSFCNMLAVGEIIAFDDFAEHLSGVLKIIDQYINLGKIQPIFAFQNTLIFKKL